MNDEQIARRGSGDIFERTAEDGIFAAGQFQMLQAGTPAVLARDL